MLKLGFIKVQVLKGGYNEWMAAKLPAVKKKITGKDRDCVTCHQVLTPVLVKEWQKSKHFPKEVSCAVCHSEDHRSMGDVSQVRQVIPDTCMMCHKDQGDQFIQGKHAFAWKSRKVTPWIHGPELAKEGCERCHLIGLKPVKDIISLKKKGQEGIATCESCHPLHGFEASKARKNSTCQKCHQGPGLDSWDSYLASVHGQLSQDKANGSKVPGCADCHMSNGNHAVDSPGGYWACSLPLPQDSEWAKARQGLLFFLGFLDKKKDLTFQANWLEQNCLLKLDQEKTDKVERKLKRVCLQCHGQQFVQNSYQESKRIIRKADLLLAKVLELQPGCKVWELVSTESLTGQETYQLYLLRQRIVHYASHQAFAIARHGLAQMQERVAKLLKQK